MQNVECHWVAHGVIRIFRIFRSCVAKCSIMKDGVLSSGASKVAQDSLDIVHDGFHVIPAPVKRPLALICVFGNDEEQLDDEKQLKGIGMGIRLRAR